VQTKFLLILFNAFDLHDPINYILCIINNKKQFKIMKNLVLVCLTILTTISLMTSCGENTATDNATPNATEVVKDSTSNAAEVLKDSTSKN
jgi:uncharacterized lipoprotein YajG